MSNKTCPQYSVWTHKKNKVKVTILGFGKIPKFKCNGIITGSEKGIIIFTEEQLLEQFTKDG